MVKYLFILNFLIYLSFINCNGQKIYNDIYSWGVNNSLEISEKIEMFFKDVNNRTYKSRAQIETNETLLLIPHKIMLNMEIALKLLDNKKLKSQYKRYVKEKIKQDYNRAKNSGTESSKVNATMNAEKAFLAYIFYIVDNKPELYIKTKFYEYFKYYINSFETDLSRMPLFYTSEQSDILLGLSINQLVTQFREVYEEEASTFTKKYFKEYVNNDEFFRYRLFTKRKAYNITGNNTMVPFLDFFKTDYFKYNANFTIENNGDVRVFAVRPIKKGEVIVLAEPKLNNMYNFVLNGKTYEEFINDIPFYNINAFAPSVYYKYQLSEDDKNFYDEFRIDLLDDDYIDKAIIQYKVLHDKFGKSENENESFYYEVLKSNIEYFKNMYEFITQERISEAFYNLEDKTNVQRLYKGEKDLVDKKYNELEKKYNEIKKKEEKEGVNKNDTKNEKVGDL